MALQKDEHRPFVLQSYYCDPAVLERLVRFYEYYNPEKISLAEALLFGYRDDPELLFTKLRERYGPEPHTVAHISQNSTTPATHAPGVRPARRSSRTSDYNAPSVQGGRDHGQGPHSISPDSHIDPSQNEADYGSLRSMMLRDIVAPLRGDGGSQGPQELGSSSSSRRARPAQNADLGLVDSSHRSSATRQGYSRDSSRTTQQTNPSAQSSTLPLSTFAPYGSFEALRRPRAPAPSTAGAGESSAMGAGTTPHRNEYGMNDSSRAPPNRNHSFARSPERDVNRNHVYATGLERLSQSPLRTPPLPKEALGFDSREYLSRGRTNLEKGCDSPQPLSGRGPQMTYALNPAEVVAKRRNKNPPRFQSYEKEPEARWNDHGALRNDYRAPDIRSQSSVKHAQDFSDEDDGACDELEDVDFESYVDSHLNQGDRANMLRGNGHAAVPDARERKSTTSNAPGIQQRGGSGQLALRRPVFNNVSRHGLSEVDEASQVSSTGAIPAAYMKPSRSLNEKYCVICRASAFRDASTEVPVWSSANQRAFQLLRHPVLRRYPFFHYRLFLLLSSAVKARRSGSGNAETVKFYVQSTKNRASQNRIASLLDGVILRGAREDPHNGMVTSSRSTSASSADSSTSSSSEKESRLGPVSDVPFPLFEPALDSRVMWEASPKSPNVFNEAFQSVEATELHTLSVWCRTIGLGKWFKDSITFADVVAVVGVAFNSQWERIRQVLLRDITERTARSTATGGHGRDYLAPKKAAGMDPSDMLLLLEVIEDVMNCARVQTTRSLMQGHAQWMRTHYSGEMGDELSSVNEFLGHWGEAKRHTDSFGYLHPSLLPATLQTAEAEEEGDADMYSTSRSSSRHYDTDRMRSIHDRNEGVMQLNRQMQAPHTSIRLPAPLPSLPLPLALLFEAMELVSFPFFGHARHHRLIFVEVEAVLYWMSVAVLVETESVERQTVIMASEQRTREKLVGGLRRLESTLALEAEEQRCRQHIEEKASTKFLKHVREFRGYIRTLRLEMHHGRDEGENAAPSRQRAAASAVRGQKSHPARSAPSSTQRPTSSPSSSHRHTVSTESSAERYSGSEDESETKSALPDSPEEHSPFRATIDLLEDSGGSATSSQLLSQYYALRQLQQKPNSHEYRDRVSDLRRPSHGRENATRAPLDGTEPYDPAHPSGVRTFARQSHDANGVDDVPQFPRREWEMDDWTAARPRMVGSPSQQYQQSRQHPAQYAVADPSQRFSLRDGSLTPSATSRGSRSIASVSQSGDSESTRSRRSARSQNRVSVPPGYGVMIVPRSHKGKTRKNPS